ncbi:FAD-dependent oxidoreductase [Williamsia sp. MIQD14]|uniref:FAD-dependent oxidoreductase n=1 Tax=Williamsia sp. MIQD14 TaxID=3425703 RepID=UPI003DA18679
MNDVDVVVIGCGAAGLAAATSILEQRGGARVTVLERAPAAHRGGNTAWTSAFFRTTADGDPSDDFADRMHTLSEGRTPTEHITALADGCRQTIDWLAGGHGVRFITDTTYFLTSRGPRLMPQGGGAAIVDALSRSVTRLGGEIRYRSTVVDMTRTDDGWSVHLDTPAGPETLRARSVVIAAGGFEGSAQMRERFLGPSAGEMRTIAPGGTHNDGTCIEVALRNGAAPAGQYDRFHGEPTDARSTRPEALVMAYPYGIVVDAFGRRFLDEGSDTPDNTFEEVAYRIWRDAHQSAFLVADARIHDIPGIERTVLSDRPPYSAPTVAALATRIGVEPAELEWTVSQFNSACVPGVFDPLVRDGVGTRGLLPPKSNWARPLVEGPFVAWPLACVITFTFGGLATDAAGRVLDTAGTAVPGLYAVGECAGIYYNSYPGATSVLRALNGGRLLGPIVADAQSAAAVGDTVLSGASRPA